MRAWLYLLRGQVLGIFLELSGQDGPERQKAFRMETLGRASFHAGALWWELRSNRLAPDSAPLRCATPGASPVTFRRWRPLGDPGVEMKLNQKKLETQLGRQRAAAAKCPECGREGSIHDGAPERRWRHLDPMWFGASIRARRPQADGAEHGLKMMPVPWAAPQGRFTLLVESVTRRDRRQRGPGFEVRRRCLLAPANRTARCRPSYLNKPSFLGPLEDRPRSQPGRALGLATPPSGAGKAQHKI